MQSLPVDNNQVTNDRLNDIEHYLAELTMSLQKISRQEIWAAIQLLYQAWEEGRHIFLCGNGGSAATASHMANDLNKLTITPGKPRLKAIALTDNIPLMTAWANDSVYADIFAEQLQNLVEPGDVLIAISASGNSPNVLRALELAHECQALTIGFTGKDGGKLKHLVDVCVFIPDEHIGRQEDGHMILDHIIANTLRDLIAQS